MESHIKKISIAVDKWLQPDNKSLKNAIDKTVDEKLFSFDDIKHQVRHLKRSINEESLEKWASKSGLNSYLTAAKNVLCLHAGNLPLVGLQDLLAITMTGLDYSGKVSTKDPYLLPTLIEVFDEMKIKGSRKWSVDLADLSDWQTDALIFSGSESSVEAVIDKLYQLKIANQDTPMLIRTAHFSIAFISNHDKEVMEQLTEAVFRYGGTGCRSVAIVVAPFSLNSQKCHFTDYVEAFWLTNPQHKKPDDNLFYRFATNKAVNISQAWLDDFLIEESVKYPSDKFILYWVKGDEQTLKEVTERFSDGLQTVYTEDGNVPESLKSNSKIEVDKLENSQTPEIWWKPDGVDTITWLINHLK